MPVSTKKEHDDDGMQFSFAYRLQTNGKNEVVNKRLGIY